MVEGWGFVLFCLVLVETIQIVPQLFYFISEKAGGQSDYVALPNKKARACECRPAQAFTAVLHGQPTGEELW